MKKIVRSRPPRVHSSKHACTCRKQLSTICFRILIVIISIILVMALGMFFRERMHRLAEHDQLVDRLARLSAYVQDVGIALQRQRYFKLAEAGDELKRHEIFSQLLVQDIETNQFQDCSTAQILLAPIPANLDLADTLSWLSLGLAVALGSNRLLLVPTERLPWLGPSAVWQPVSTCHVASYLCFFKPWSDCSTQAALSLISGHRPVSFLNATGSERVVLFDLPPSAPVHWPESCPLCWAAFPDRSPFVLPTVCPDCVLSRRWYLGELVSWIVRPNPNLANLVATRKTAVGWLAPVAGFFTSPSAGLSSLQPLHPNGFRHFNWYPVGPLVTNRAPDAPYRSLQASRPASTNLTQLALDSLVDLLLLGESHVLAGSADTAWFRVACRLARHRRRESLCYSLVPQQLDWPYVDEDNSPLKQKAQP